VKDRAKQSSSYSHTGGDLHGGVSKLMVMCAGRSLRSAAWSSRRSSDLARTISRCVADLLLWYGRGGFSGAMMLVRRWLICRFSPTLSMGGDRSWSKTTRGRPLFDVPQRHMPCCVQRVCSSTHKASLTIVFAWIWHWWRLDVPSIMRLDGSGVGRRPLALVVAGNLRDRFVFLDLLWFYLQNFQDNHFISVCLLVSTYVVSCNLIFN
jgi:hypothetical protein